MTEVLTSLSLIMAQEPKGLKRFANHNSKKNLNAKTSMRMVKKRKNLLKMMRWDKQRKIKRRIVARKDFLPVKPLRN